MRRGHALAMVAVMALTGTAACGSADKDGAAPRVATLVSEPPAPGPSASGKDAGPQRPRERIDMTSDELDALRVPYEKCLKSKGVDQVGAKKAQDARMKGQPVDEGARYCEDHYLPLPPWEKDPANPDARDFAVAVVKCLKGKGVKYVEVSDDGISLELGGPHNDAKSISKGLDLSPQCEREVAAKKK
jgi:hypothetical protein